MANFQIPGSLCSTTRTASIDDGTMCCQVSANPMSVGSLFEPQSEPICRVDDSLSMFAGPQSPPPTVTASDEETGRFTFEAEGHIAPSDPYYIGKLSHPSAKSGVTIGAGYDMGGRTETVVKNDLTAAGMDAVLAGKLAKGAGLTGTQADTFVTTNKATLIVSDLTPLRKLFSDIYPDYVATAQDYFIYHTDTFRASMKAYGLKYKDATYFEWQYLYPAIRVMAVDFVYQGFGRKTAGFGKPLHFCMANNFDWLIAYIQNTPELNQHEAGRGRAKYLKERKDEETRLYSRCLPQ